jgi:hypothetical protein
MDKAKISPSSIIDEAVVSILLDGFGLSVAYRYSEISL